MQCNAKAQYLSLLFVALLTHGIRNAESFFFTQTARISKRNHQTSRRSKVLGEELQQHHNHEEYYEGAIPRAQDALISPHGAAKIRRYRSSRGRLVSSQPVVKEETRSNNTSSPRQRIQQKRPNSEEIGLDRAVAKSLSKKKKLAIRTTKVTAEQYTPPRSNVIDLPYETTILALRAYHQQHGDLTIPRRFTVPLPIEGDASSESVAYPPEWHGADLSSLYCLEWWQKHVKEKPARVAELNELGFVWERLQPEWNLILEALMTYSELHGDMLVPAKFVVPTADEKWSKACWGMPLGNCVHRIRNRDDFLRGNNAASRRAQLDGLGFIWDVQESKFKKFYVALRHFAKLKRCGKFSNINPQQRGGTTTGRTEVLRVPSTFMIPIDDDQWPKELWGFPLGAKCTAVRQKELYIRNKPERQQMLQELGFRYSGNACLGWLEVMHAAAIYSRMNNRNLNVPFNFAVPAPPPAADNPSQNSMQAEEDWPWPEHLWGFPLGQRLKDVRVRGAYLSGEMGAERRRQLDALGFNWKPKRGRPKKTVENKN